MVIGLSEPLSDSKSSAGAQVICELFNAAPNSSSSWNIHYKCFTSEPPSDNPGAACSVPHHLITDKKLELGAMLGAGRGFGQSLEKAIFLNCVKSGILFLSTMAVNNKLFVLSEIQGIPAGKMMGIVSKQGVRWELWNAQWWEAPAPRYLHFEFNLI